MSRQKRPALGLFPKLSLVELAGIEPATFGLPVIPLSSRLVARSAVSYLKRLTFVASRSVLFRLAVGIS